MSGYNGQAQTFFAPDLGPPQKWGYTFVTLNQTHVHARKDKIVIIQVRSSYTDTVRANSQNKKIQQYTQFKEIAHLTTILTFSVPIKA